MEKKRRNLSMGTKTGTPFTEKFHLCDAFMAALKREFNCLKTTRPQQGYSLRIIT